MRIVEIWICVLVLAITAAPSASAAEACSKHSPEAAALFDRGKALFDVDRLDEASARLEESQRLEPSVGTLGLLAACHEKQGHLLAAFRAYVEAATRAAACGDDREMFAWERAADLNLRLPRLRISRVDPDVVIALRQGGAVARVGKLGDDLVVDPGLLEIVAWAPGKIDFVRILALAEGARVDVDIPALAPAAPQQRSPQGAPGRAPQSRSRSAPAAPSSAR